MAGLAAKTMVGLPGLDLQLMVGLLLHFFLASLRIGAFLIASPLFGARWLPLQVRIMLAFSVGIIVTSSMPTFSASQIAGPAGIVMVVTEIGVGLAAGLVLTIFFAAVMLAGEKIASSAGLGYAAQVDPQTGGQTPVVSQTLYLLLLVLFLSVDGHLIAIATMLESYRVLPIGAAVSPQALIGAGIAASGAMFVSATVIMLPIAMVLLMINVGIGIITKSAPQLNLFSFGFPISLLAVFVLLFVSVGSIGESMQALINTALGAVEAMIGEAANG